MSWDGMSGSVIGNATTAPMTAAAIIADVRRIFSSTSSCCAKYHVGATVTAVAVLIPFATPSPRIMSPTMTPIMGPGITKFRFARGSIISIMPLAASNPATR
jgi:hypothetical protein